MSFIEGSGRDQQLLFPAVLDDYITEKNPVRFIDCFVESLEMSVLGFERAEPAETGRPGYDPRDLLRLYAYGYVNGIRSSRKLEREAQRNVELMWLMRKLRPDFKTIADFRRNNGAALRQVCREFTLVCKKLNLFGLELIAVDGSKFRASNGQKRNFTRGELEDDIRGIDRRIEGYLEELDKSDEEEAEIHTPTAEELRQHIEKLKKKREARADLLGELDRSGESQISLTDPDSRSMKAGMGTEVCYNVQTAVDEKHKLIVANDVINSPTDANGLAPIARQAQEILGVEGLKAVADQG